MFDLKKYIQKKNRVVNDTLVHLLQNSQQDETIAKAMKYSLMAGGWADT